MCTVFRNEYFSYINLEYILYETKSDVSVRSEKSDVEQKSKMRQLEQSERNIHLTNVGVKQ